MNVFCNPTVILIYGMPGNGKSFLGNEIHQLSKNSILIHSDLLFHEDGDRRIMWDFYNSFPNGNIYDITLSKEFTKYKFLMIYKLVNKIENILDENKFISNIIIEGFSVKYLIDYLELYFKEKNITKVLKFEMKAKEIFNGDNTVIANTDKKLDSIKRLITDGNILTKSNYQSFDFLGDCKKDSSSCAKYECAKLDDISLENKIVLDIGCNAGYFIYRLLNKNPEKVIGLDNSGHYCSIAYEINKTYFDSNKVLIINDSLFNINERVHFILCTSTLHYFVDQQQNFFDKCFDLLYDNGHLLVEVEEYDHNEMPEIIKKSRNNSLSFLDYPNEKMVLEMIKNKFIIQDKFKSVFQPGQFFDRYFYSLRRL
jgi:SAM-dependent methyltransferase